MRKLIIAGGRDFSDYDMLKKEVSEFIKTFGEDSIEIVSGTARGADSLGERYALEHGHLIKKFPANWNKYGRAAGPFRNAEMAEYANACIVFWDGKSSGTKSMIHLAEMNKLNLKIVHTTR